MESIPGAYSSRLNTANYQTYHSMNSKPSIINVLMQTPAIEQLTKIDKNHYELRFDKENASVEMIKGYKNTWQDRYYTL